jgi:hypothetical protein
MLCFALLALMVVPASSAAQGNSGADQYREGVPDGGGETPPGDLDADGSGPSVDQGTRDALSSSGGDDGELLADLADATAPAQAKRNNRRSANKDSGSAKTSGASQDADAAGAAGESTEQAVRSSLGSGPGGLGLGLPALMLVGFVAAVAIRFRGRSPGDRS